MKRLFIILNLFFVIFCSGLSPAQTARNSWSLGFGFSYPRFQSTDVRPQEKNYGAFISLQRYFSEKVALRVKGSFLSMEGRIPGDQYYYNDGTLVPSMTEYMHTDVMSGDIDIIYNLSPCSSASPYFGIGIGITSFKPKWNENIVNPEADSYVAGQMNFIFGTEWNIAKNWELITELSYHSLSGKLDGISTINRDGVLGSYNDGYISFNAGFQYYFVKGEVSHYCDLYSGIKFDIPREKYPTLDQIEDIVKRYSSEPADVDYNRIEEIIKAYHSNKAKTEPNWILYGVNFDFNKSSLTPGSYPVLDHAVELLTEHNELKVEIQGYTDNAGPDAVNQKLSELRASAVKEYLVSKGISAERLTTVGMGELNPVADNTTPAGREKNRRVEFKISK
jgi:hypothetical protein